jgi:hypothetical protein
MDKFEGEPLAARELFKVPSGKRLMIQTRFAENSMR